MSIPVAGFRHKYVHIDRFIGSKYEPPVTIQSRDIANFIFSDFGFKMTKKLKNIGRKIFLKWLFYSLKTRGTAWQFG